MSTRHQGSDREKAALDVFIKLMRCVESVNSRLSPELEAAGLTTSQFGVLEALYHLGPLCMTEISRKILKTGGNVTLVVKNLKARKLVERKREGKDRRYFLISLTPSGKKLIERVFPSHARRMADIMATLSAAEQTELGRLASKLGQGAEKEGFKTF